MTPHDGWTLDALIEGYRQHQRRTRGLRDQTLRGYERLARLLVGVALGDDPIDLTRLNPTDVMAFVSSMRGRYSPRSMKTPLCSTCTDACTAGERTGRRRCDG